MAKKLTKAQLRERSLYADFTEEELNDPRVLALEEAAKRRREEEERRAQDDRVRKETARARTPSLDSFGSQEGMREALERPAAPPARSAAEQRSGLGNFVEAVGQGAGAAWDSLAAGGNQFISDTNPLSQFTRTLEEVGGGDWSDFRPIEETAREQAASAQERGRLAAEARAQLSPGSAFAAEALGTALNPATGASLIPGIGVPLAMGAGGLMSYGNARAAGVDPLTAAGTAVGDAAWEGIGAKVGGSLFKIAPNLGSVAGNAVKRVATTAAGESIGEGLTAAGQGLSYKGLDKMDVGDAELQRYAASQSADIWHNIALSMVAGGGMGGVMSTPGAMLEYSATMGEYAAKQQALLLEANKRTEVKTPSESEVDTAAINAFLTAPLGTKPNLDFQPRNFDGVPVTDPNMQARAAELQTAANQNNFLTAPMGAAPVDPLRQSPLGEVNAPLQGNPDPEWMKSRKEAEKLVADKEKSIAAAAKRKYTAATTKAKNAIVQQSLSLPEAERADYVMAKLADWRAANPENKPAAPVAPTTAAPVAAPAATTQEETEDPSSLLGKLDGMQQKPSDAGNLTSVDVIQELMRTRGSRNSNIATELLTNNQVKLVESAEDIPTNAKKINTKGWYDGENTYVVASNLNPDNVMGDLLSVMGHETKHGVDVSGYEHVLGKQANSSIIKQGRELIKRGDADAIYAFRGATGLSDEDAVDPNMQLNDIEEKEFVSYLINNAMEKQGGVWGGIARNATLGLRVAANKLRGNPTVKVDDLKALTKNMLEDVALSKQKLTGNINEGMSMIMGERATNFAQAEGENRVYTSRDGSRRFVISDKDSKLDYRSLQMVADGKETKLGDLLDHDELYTNYPEIADGVKIGRAPEGSNYGAIAFGNQILLPRETLALGYVRPDKLRSILLHETQHIVQDREGHSPGGMPEDFYTEADKKTIRTGNSAIGSLQLETNSLGLPTVTEVVSPEDNARLKELRAEAKKNKSDAPAAMTEAIEILSKYQDRGIVNLTKTLIDRVGEASEAWFNKIDVEQKARASYMSLLGETDARFTENNMDSSLEELPVNPESTYPKDLIIAEPEARAGGMAQRVRPPREQEETINTGRRNFLRGASAIAVGAAVARATGGVNSTTMGKAQPVSKTLLESKVDPKIEALLRDTGGNDNLKLALRELATNGPKEFRALANDLVRLLPDMLTVYVDDNVDAGLHGKVEFTDSRDVAMTLYNAKASDGYQLLGLSYGTLLHESLHAVVVSRYRTLSMGAIMRNYSVVGSRTPAASKELEQFLDIWNEFKKQAEGLPDEAYNANLHLAYEDPDEFFVRILTDPEFQASLSKMEYKKGKLIDRFKDWVRNTLFGKEGVRPSWLDAALMTADDLLKAMNADRSDFAFLDAVSAYEADDSRVTNRSERTGGMAQMLRPRDRTAAAQKSVTSTGTWQQKTLHALTRMLPGDQGLGRALDEQRLYGANVAASLALKAEQMRNDLDSSIETAAKLANVDREEIITQINKVLESSDKLHTGKERRSAVAALNRRYPGAELGSALNAIRQEKWRMATELIKLRAADTERRLTKKEVAMYDKMIETAERWTTRAYQSMMSGRDLYAKTFMKRAAQEGTKEKAYLEDALSLLTSNYLALPADTDLESLDTDKLKALYTAWEIGNTRTIAEAPDNRDDLIEKLAFLRDATAETFETKALEIAKDMIGFSDRDTAGARMARGMRQNRTVIEARTDIPVEFRRIMGEITDPYMREALSVARLSQLVASTKSLSNLHQDGKDIYWSDKRTDKFEHALSSPSFGALDGKYVSQDVFDLLGAFTEYNNTFDAELKAAMTRPEALARTVAGAGVRGLQGLSKLYKISTVMSSTSNMTMNFLGAFTTLAKNGVFNPVHTLRGLHDTAALFITQKGRNADEARMKVNQELLLAGVTDSAQSQEFRSEAWNQLAREIRDGNVDTFREKFANKFKDYKDISLDVLGDTYAFMDVWSKTATYYSNKDFLTRYNKAEGLGWTDEQIIREAGYDTTLSTISYNRASPLVRAIERNVPMLGGFLTYKMESIRSIYGGMTVASRYAQLAHDAKTPAGKLAATTHATKIIGGTLAATAGVIAATMQWLDDQDEEDKKKRALFADWEEDKVHVFIGTDDEGREHYMSINRLDPIGPHNEAVTTFLRSLQKEEGFGTATLEALKGFVTTFKIYADVTKTITDTAALSGIGERSTYQRETVYDRLWPNASKALRESTPESNLGANALAIADSLTPAQLAVWFDPKRLNVKGDGQELARGLKLAGYKDVVVDPNASLGFAAKDYTDAIKELNGRKAGLMKAVGNPAKMLEDIYALQEDERKAFDKLKAATEGYTYFNRPKFFEGEVQDTKSKLTMEDASPILKDRKVPREALTSLMTGEFESTLVKGDLIDKWLEKQLTTIKKTDPEYTQKVEDAKSRALLLEEMFNRSQK